MVCTSALQAAFNKHCIICNRMIAYGNYQTVRTKARTSKKVTYPAKTLYVHTECYNKEYNQQLPIFGTHGIAPMNCIAK